MKGRKNGCPVNIRNWLIYILDVATQEFVRIYGLTSMNREISSSTEDGSADTDTWEEPYVTKRSGSVSLEGKEVVDALTGESDPGQEILNSYADSVGCDGDATLKFIDPYGHAWIGDYIIGSRKQTADDSSTSLSWDLSQVGEVEVLPYVQVSGVALKDGDNTITSLTFDEGDPAKIVTVAFTPDNASNKRFKVSNKKRSVATVGNVTENGFTITPVAVGETVIAVNTVNGGKTATINVTVNAAK
ncbi:MAG: hypothetical protein IKH75_01150 [Ruminococcus sp.]|nr:hypothetical protein [Ruminococcus sp.]